MPSDPWTRIDALLAHALTLPAADRQDYLREACGQDETLRSEVQALLDAADAADARFGESWGLGDHLKEEALLDALDPPLEPDERIGPYRLIRRIGRGGMGSVYLAERVDEQFQRQVALKVVGSGVMNEEALARFLRERQILARLQHPAIARLYTGGFTEDGRPYFAMEYVDGETITEYCDGRRLDLAARLGLFQEVAEAVTYAHRSLVIHRDLKPSNILVTRDGSVKLLDFGIAKMLEEDPHVVATRTGAGFLTPGYASPEQVLGNSITTESDVYQLGVLLSELLTGQLPHGARGRTPFELQRAIVEDDPLPPSERVQEVDDPVACAEVRGTQPAALARSLRGDLDTIVMKTLKKDLESRYGSVIELAADLDRHRKGLPVSARPATLGYRMMSFMRRHRVAVSAAAVFLILLCTYAVTVTSQAREIRRERNRAELERDRALRERATAEQVTATFADLFQSADPYAEELEGGGDVRVRDFLERSAARVQEELGDQPEIQAQLLNVLGTVQLNLGEYDQAEPLFRQEMALREEMGDEGSPELANVLSDLGLLLQERGELQESEALFRRAQSMQRETLPPADPRLAVTLTRLGGLLWFNKGDYEGAEEVFREALEIRRTSLDRDSPDLTSSLNSMANLLQNQGDLAGAESYYREAIQLYREQLGDHPNVAIVQANFAGLLRDEGKLQEAEAVMREALEAHRRLQGGRNIDVALGLGTLGSILLAQGYREEADSLFKEAIPRQVEFFGEGHPYVLRTHLFQAHLMVAEGRLEEAESALTALIQAYDEALPPEHYVRAAPLVLLGRVRSLQGRSEQALTPLRKAAELLKGTFPDTHWRLAEARGLMGAALAAGGEYEEAESLLLEAASVLEEQRGLNHGHTQEAILELSRLYEAWGRPEEAEQHRSRLVRTEPSQSAT
jgi:serine/threonine-protein kinase